MSERIWPNNVYLGFIYFSNSNLLQYKRLCNLFRYPPSLSVNPLQQQSTIYPFVFQRLTKPYFCAVTFFYLCKKYHFATQT